MNKIEKYYNSDKWISSKIREFINGNKRIDECISFFEQVKKKKESNIAEIGCSIGLTTYTLGKKFPKAYFTGIDIAEEQISFAKENLSLANTSYLKLDITSNDCAGLQFDCITLFDVYEHIPKQDRKAFNQALNSMLSVNGRLLITSPSWMISKWKQDNKKERMQVVDEIVSISDYEELAKDISGEVSFLSLKSIWQQFDYCHCIITKERPLVALPSEVRKSNLFDKVYLKLKNSMSLGKDKTKIEIESKLHDYLNG